MLDIKTARENPERYCVWRYLQADFRWIRRLALVRVRRICVAAFSEMGPVTFRNPVCLASHMELRPPGSVKRMLIAPPWNVRLIIW